MQGFQIKFENYSIGGTNYRIRSLLDKQQYSDPAGLAERTGISPANWSLFGVVWPSGQMLARIMSKRAIKGLRILEVGCGLALASIVLKHRGADITASDWHPLMMPFLSVNTSLNDLACIETITGDWAANEANPELFDLIIGADLLYEQDHFAQLSAFIDRHAQATAEVIIVDPNRGHVGKFSRRMRGLGYDCSEERTDTTLAHDEPYRGRIMTYRRGKC